MKEGWTYKKLGEVANFYRGLTYGKNDEAESSNVCVLRSNNIDLESMSLNFDEIKYLRPDFVIPDDKKLKGNSIFICMSNGSKQHVGKVAFIENDMDYAFGGFMGLIVPSKVVSAKYIYYVCCSSLYRRFLASIGNGIGITNLKFIDLHNFSLPITNISQQLQIVSELDLLSGVIEKQKAQIKELDKLAQSIFYDMFGDPVTNEKGWDVKRLNEISEIGTGSTPNRNNIDYYDSGTIPWVKTTEVQNCDIYDTEEKITELALKETNCKVYPIGTLLMAMYGQGKTRGQLAKLRIPAATNQACAAIQINDLICSLDYLYNCLLLLYDDIRSMAQGGNQANLNLKLVSSIRIILPPLALQQEFAAKVEAIEAMKAKVRQSLIEAETLFNSRMDYYFN